MLSLNSSVKDGKLRFYVDYRALNRMTIRNVFPVPSADELLDHIYGAKVFSLVELWSAYHQVRVSEPDIPKTAFNTHSGHYEYLVVAFGLKNDPATFQTLMNLLFSHLPFVVVYLDDILILSKDEEEHLSHLRQVCEVLRDNKLFAKQSK